MILPAAPFHHVVRNSSQMREETKSRGNPSPDGVDFTQQWPYIQTHTVVYKVTPICHISIMSNKQKTLVLQTVIAVKDKQWIIVFDVTPEMCMFIPLDLSMLASVQKKVLSVLVSEWCADHTDIKARSMIHSVKGSEIYMAWSLCWDDLTHPIRDSSPRWPLPSFMACARAVTGSFFCQGEWKDTVEKCKPHFLFASLDVTGIVIWYYSFPQGKSWKTLLEAFAKENVSILY